MLVIILTSTVDIVFNPLSIFVSYTLRIICPISIVEISRAVVS